MMLRMPIRAKLRDALLHSTLDDVLQVDHAQQALAVAHRQRRSAGARNAVAHVLEVARDLAAPFHDERDDRVGGALSELATLEVDSAHPRVRRERNERRLMLRDVPAAKTVFFFREDHNGSTFGRLVGQAR